jgi:hypothetical protein
VRLRVSAVAVALVAATALVGCSHDEASSTKAPQKKVTDVQDQPGSVKGYVGASKDAKITECEPEGDSLRVEGTVNNPKTSLQDYRIYVSALKEGNTVGLVQVDVSDVPGGKSQTWSTDIAYDAKDLKCLLRVERFAAK